MSNRKVALITGASSGIGAATARQFAELGYSLALYAKNVSADIEGLARTKEECLKLNKELTTDNILTMTGDLVNEKDCDEFVVKTIEKFTKIDVLVANAGIASFNPLLTMSMDEYDKVMNINIRAVVYINKLVIPHLIKTKGNVVNVSSIAGLAARPNMMAYCLSKAALVQLTRCTALELASQGVRVNAVNPSVIADTRLASNTLNRTNAEATYAMMMESAKKNPLGRPGTPEEVAKSIAFLASDDQASFMTGICLTVDGGRHLS